tara:strand:+ start:416 stop:1030 length:615 start_codon:yes stop_codon:yes gene_type:complete
MTKLCPRGKAAAKRKFSVYPSAYANAYASKICAGKIKDPSGKKRKDFRGPKPSKAMGGRIYKAEGGSLSSKDVEKITNKVKKFSREFKLAPGTIKKMKEMQQKRKKLQRPMGGTRPRKMGGGMMQMPRAMYKKGGKSFPDLSGDGKVTMKDVLMGRGVIPRKGKKGGGLMEATSRLRAQGLKAGGVAKGCGAVMNEKRKVTKMY